MVLEEFTTEERIQIPYHHIAPGFINKRLCFSTFGHRFRQEFDNGRRYGEDHWTQLYNDHLLVYLALAFCRATNVKSLGEVLPNAQEGGLFCSTEEVRGSNTVYETGRTTAQVLLPYSYPKQVVLEFGTEHFVASTTRSEVASGAKLSLICGIRRVSEDTVIAWPLIMGAPSFDHPLNKDFVVEPDRLVWYARNWCEIFPHDIDEFEKISDIEGPPPEEWAMVMSQRSEEEVKLGFCEILGELPRKDWAGEQADHLSSSVHLGGERVTAAFLFKGPARFREMIPDMLGKRADQIYRLANTPAQLLVVQHCHQIGEAVRATLRAFAATPHNPRRYCLIDGKDTFKILQAYGKL